VFCDDNSLTMLFIDNVLRGLQFCHAKGIIHCDVKAANIIYDANCGVFRLIDFGSARIQEMGPHTYLPHAENVNPNTYQPPEILNGQSFNEQVDIFALGCTISVLLGPEDAFTNHIAAHCRSAEDALRFLDEYVCFEPAKALLYITNDYFREIVQSMLTYWPQCRPSATSLLIAQAPRGFSH
jgi:serine/threonine protein kinase